MNTGAPPTASPAIPSARAQGYLNLYRYLSRTDEERWESWAFHAYCSDPYQTELRESEWLAAWLHCVSFDWFITFCPDIPIYLPNLKFRVTEFMERLTAELTRAHYGEAPLLGYVVGYESIPCPNSHVCLISKPRTPSHLLHSIATDLFGTNPNVVDIQPYYLGGNALSYSLKAADRDPRGDWDFSSNLALFLPRETAHTRRRRIRRKNREHRFLDNLKARYGLSAI